MKFSLKNITIFIHWNFLTINVQVFILRKPDIYLHIYLHFVPNKDCDSSCLKTLIGII